MKTSNKILLVGLIVLLLGITAVLTGTKVQYEKHVADQKQQITTQTRKMDAFECIHAKGNISIEWTQEDEQKVVVKADKSDIDKIRTNVRNGCLNISAYDIAGTEPTIEISVQNLNEITLAERCEFDTKSNVSLEKLKLTMHSNSEADFHGEAKSAIILCSSNSELDAEDFKLESCTLEATDNAKAEVYVTETLNVVAKSNSDVEYYGNPKTVNIDTDKDSDVKKD
ncbi:MAG: GIN domain-containing protein [Bacteroidota bacterium]